MSGSMVENLFRDLPGHASQELFTELLSRPGVRIERIVSTGQATPPGQWLEQAWDEWVLLLRGSAGLTLQGEAARKLEPGDCLLIAAGRRHRVDWTSTDEPTVWLAAHMM
jgi:cupin 2 domain-containing protein